MYLNNVWYCVALSEEISRQPFKRTICDEPVVLYRTEAGGVAALEDRCGHRQAPLSKGRLVGDNIQCMYHGYTYGASGACQHVPFQTFAPRSADIRAYPVAERWGYIWLWRGDAASADQNLIPSLPWVEAPDQRSVFMYFHAKANFQLVTDNLLDETHADFLHNASIGTDAGLVDSKEAKVSVKCHTEGDKVFYERKVENTLLGPVISKWFATELPATRTSTEMWEAPNTIHNVQRFHNEETDRTVHMEHLMTPETETSCHYFMNWTRNFGLDNNTYPTDADIKDAHLAIIYQDDIPMIEAQSNNLISFPNARDVASKEDVFIVSVHRALMQAHQRVGNVIPAELQRGGKAKRTDIAAA
jgi:vanillate O-demethylase monooxygenase subunit